MLIRRLRAENFMKFRDLELSDLPSRGLIGIVGRNEGGKTTLGELIQFALFGKTLSVERGSILDLIHWDRDHCVVELEFSHEGVYRVWREIDRYGTNYARLLKVDPDDPEKTEEIASGSMPVARELEARLRFSFDDFLRSFYLAERDFPRSPEHMRTFLDRMTGVEVLLSAREAAGGKIGELEERFGQIQSQVRKNEQQISRYVPNVAKIPELEEALSGQDQSLGAQKEEQRRAQEEHAGIESRITERDGLGGRLEKLGQIPVPRLREEVRALRKRYHELPDLSGEEIHRTQILEGLDQLDRLGEEAEELRAVVEKAEGAIAGRLDGDGSESYRGQQRDESRRLDRARSRRRMRIVLSTLFFLAGLAVGGLALHDHFLPETPWIPSEWGEAGNTVVILGFVAGVCWVLAAAFAGRASQQRHEIIDADGALSRLTMDAESAGDTRGVLRSFHAAYTKSPIATVADPVQSVRQEAVAEKAKALRTRAEQVIDGADPDLFRAMAAAEKKIVSRTKNTAKEARKKVQEASETLKKMQSKRDRVQSEIREYQKQDGRRAELEEKNAQLRKEGSELREEMDVHHLAQELLGETVDSIRHRAGPNLGKGIRRLLPFLTDDRYQDLQVTADFELKLFTGAKSDFLETHELSGGTLEGLSFGFRLAFAQAFVGAVTRAPQCLFLDEPFRAMDRERVRKTLHALHRLSDELPQIFVVLPDLDAQDRAVFDAIIETEVGTPELRRSLEDDLPVRTASTERSPSRERGSAQEGASPRDESSRREDPRPAVEKSSENSEPSRSRRRERKSREREERRPRRERRRRERRDRDESKSAPEGASEEASPPPAPPARSREEDLARGTYHRTNTIGAKDDGAAPDTPTRREDRGARAAESAPVADDRQALEAEIQRRETRPLSERAGVGARAGAPEQSPTSSNKGAAEIDEATPRGPSETPSGSATAPTPPRSPEPQRASAEPASADSAPPEARERRAPGKVREDAAESPSQFLAGIFDDDPSRR